MPPLPRRLYVYITAIVCLAGTTSWLTTAALADSIDVQQAWLAPILLVLLVIAAQFPLRLAPRHQQELSPAPGLAAVILLPPPVAVGICVAGQLVAELRSERLRPAQVIFNTAAVSLQSAAAAIAVVLVEARVRDPAGPGGLLVIGMAALSWFAVGATLTEAAVALQVGRRPGHRWWERQGLATKVEACLLIIGGFAALLVDIRPWLLPLLIVPVVAVYQAFATQQLSLRAERTGRERAEQARRRLAALIDTTPDFVLTLDSSSTITYANPAARSLLALPDAFELSSFPVDQVFPGWKRATMAASTHGSWSGESTIATPGGLLPVSQVVLVHRSPRGEVEFISTVARDIRERKAFERRLMYVADHDMLTGVFNRRRFESEVDQRLERARRSGSHGALMYIDLDGFKEVNDTHGHWAGDQLLQHIARALRDALQETDGTVGRLGGDEFGVLVNGLDPDGAAAVAARLLAAIRGCVLDVGGRSIALTGSVGVAPYGGSRMRRDDLLAMADCAMYEAKQAGDGYRFARTPFSGQLTG